MASKKTHLFRQSAVEAGNPGDYYINPSEKLMSRSSDWSAVEHEDYVETRFNMDAFNTPVLTKRYNNQAIGDCENKDDEYGYIVNTGYLNLKEMKGELKDGITICYYPKIRVKGDDENESKNKKKNKKKKKNSKNY